jgi:HSP90 family molecular chaperone
MTANMERIMRAQALRGGSSMNMGSTRVMVLNTQHPTIQRIYNELKTATPETDASGNELPVTTYDSTIELLYNASALSAGYAIDDVHAFAQTLFDRI